MSWNKWLLKIQEVMDFVDCTDDIESRSVEHNRNNRNAMSEEHCHGICSFIPHLQYAIVHSSCPLPDSVMIGVVGRPVASAIGPDRKLQLKKQLLDMVKESTVILQKVNYLEEQLRIAIEDVSTANQSTPSGSDGKKCHDL